MNQGSHILTLRNGFHLFTRIMGTGSIKLLCVHGGPGSTHEEFENFAQGLAKLPVQVAMYDQLGSFYSDQPDFNQQENQKFLNIEYFLSELEEVREQLNWNNFYLLGHSWGGLLAQEYALKYGQHLQGLIIMSMIDNIPEYTQHINYLRDQTFTTSEVNYMKDVETQERFSDPMYNQLVQRLYKIYVMRHPENGPRHLISTNATAVYNRFQGNNEFVMTGSLKNWDHRFQTNKINAPTLLTFGDHDTMPLNVAARMHKQLPHSRFVLTPDGGHCHSIDNPSAFFKNLGDFLSDVHNNRKEFQKC